MKLPQAHSPSPYSTWGGEQEGRRIKREVGPERKAGLREDGFSFVVISPYPTLLQVIGNKAK